MQIGAASPDPLRSGVAPAMSPGAPARGGQAVPFSQLMGQLMQEADKPQHVVANSIDQLMTGDVDQIHDLAINMAQADIAFRLVMEVRDKLISAYQDVMRMQV